MYVCICSGVTDRAIYEAVDRGVRTLSELTLDTGVATQCGTCASVARKVLKEAVSEKRQISLPVINNPAFIT